MLHTLEIISLHKKTRMRLNIQNKDVEFEIKTNFAWKDYLTQRVTRRCVIS